MRLKEFHGYGIRGYLDHNITFRESTTILIGVNGTGKTTVLNLIQGLFKPSYRILESIEFKSIEVIFNIDEYNYDLSLSCKKDKETLEYALRADQEIISQSQISRILNAEESDNETRESAESYFRKCEEFEKLETCRIVSTYKAPMFLTIDRTPQELDFDRIARNEMFHNLRFGRIKNNIDTCLVAIQDAIRKKQTANASKQNNFIVNLRNSIFKTSLAFMADDFTIPEKPGRLLDSISTLEQREIEFMEVIDGLEIPGIHEIATDFFSKLKEAGSIILGTAQGKPSQEELSQAITRMVYSQAQLKRVEEISKLGHEYQEKIAKLKEPMVRFKQCVNMFFNECGKELVLDSSGQMKVILPKGSAKRMVNSVSELSSGEKQIVAMLGSLIFLQDEKKPDVYFIDEPEVSLHLAWQDIFVDALLKACPNYQFVLATHSPNIVARKERRNWCADLSQKF